MVGGTILYVGMMLMTAVLRAGVHPWVTIILVAGAIPALAIATVTVVEAVATRHRDWPGITQGGELKTLAARLETGGRTVRS